MELMLSGKPVRAEKALRLGLIDRLVPEAELRRCAREMLLRAPAPRRAPWPQRLLSSAPLRPLARGALMREAARRAPREHYPAPYAITALAARYRAHAPPPFEAEPGPRAQPPPTPRRATPA